MKTPASFGGTTGVLNVGMFAITLMYVAMGFFGYVKYGEFSKGSVTLNLPESDKWDKLLNIFTYWMVTEFSFPCRLAQAVKLIFAFAIFITYALQAYVPVDIIWNTYMKKRIQNWDKATMEYLLRISVVLITCKSNIKIDSWVRHISIEYNIIDNIIYWKIVLNIILHFTKYFLQETIYYITIILLVYFIQKG